MEKWLALKNQVGAMGGGGGQPNAKAVEHEKKKNTSSNPLATPFSFVLMRYQAIGAVAVRRKGGGQVLQVTGLGGPKLHKEIAERCKKEWESGKSEGV